MSARYFPVAAFLLLSAWSAAAQSAACPAAKANAAETAADHLTSWKAVAAYYRHYRGCDDGGMAEASSEGVARLLADRWATLPDLAAEARKAPGLRVFVTAHINSTLDTADIEKIAHAASSSCPAGEARLCNAIAGAARRALI